MNCKELFENLLSHFKDYPKAYRIKVDTTNQAPIYLGVSSNKRPVFFFDVPVSFSELSNDLSDTAGYFVFKDKVENNCIRIGIEATTEYSFEVFFVVVDDLISIAYKEEIAPSLVVINRLLMWEDFFKHSANGVISNELQVGLFGELLFIEEQLEKGNSKIISPWKGPDKEVKDFVIGNTAIEVKTSIITSTNRIKISDENQLDSSGLTILFLNVRLLIQDQMDGRSLPELINSIEDLLNDDPISISTFKEKLMHVGYVDSMSSKYERKYEASDNLWYNVEDKGDNLFPRIVPSDLNKGVKFVQYQIELSTMAQFAINTFEVEKALEKECI